MDLFAYAQIENLQKIMKENGIEVRRLRGLRLMKDEKPIPKDKIEETIKESVLDACKMACRSDFEFNADWAEYSQRTNAVVKKYMNLDNECDPVSIKWNKLHGKKRKTVKYEIRKARERIEKNLKIFNKYCGRDDVLYIHARLGGGNWYYFGGADIEKQPWFIEKVDDLFDTTYCDIYARINQVKQDEL